MIFTFLTAARAFLARIPWQAWLFLAVIVTAWLYGNHRYSQGYAASEAKHAAIAAQAVAQAGKADAAAQTTVDAGNALTGAENDAARKAGDASDDRLKGTMDSLRGKK